MAQYGINNNSLHIFNIKIVIYFVRYESLIITKWGRKRNPVILTIIREEERVELRVNKYKINQNFRMINQL